MTTEYTQNFQIALPDFRMGPWHDLINGDLRKIDALLFSAMSQADVQPWTNATNYIPGTTVVDSTDATVWVCVVLHTSAVAPTTFLADRTAHPTFWTRLLTGFAPRGQWTQNTQYFPYDLAFDTAYGIMALCEIGHVSTATGSILDDEANWAFLMDMSDADLALAAAISYNNTATGIAATNVQTAIDLLHSFIVSLNGVNVSQGNAITALQGVDTTHTNNITALGTRMTTAEGKITSLEGRMTTAENKITALQAIPDNRFPIGTIMLFFQGAPPLGWTAITGWHDRMIRLVGDTSGGGAGGIYGFSTIFAQYATSLHALTIPQMPFHEHPMQNGSGNKGPPFEIGVVVGDLAELGVPRTGGIGGNEGHQHAMEMRCLYINAVPGQRTS